MSRNFQACWTCRIRRKGGCEGPGPTGDCAICIELNIECLHGYGERVPREYRRPEIVEELSRWNRRKSSRHAPEKFLLSVLLEQVQTSEAAQNVPTPIQAEPLSSGDMTVLDQNTFNPLPQTHRDIHNAPLVPPPMAGITRSSNPSPTVSSSSSIRSTLSPAYPDPEDSQGSPVHILEAQAPHQHPQSSSQSNLLSEIASDYTIYLSQLTPFPQVSSLSGVSSTAPAPMSSLAGRPGETGTSYQTRLSPLGTESSIVAHGSASVSSPQTSLQELSNQAGPRTYTIPTLSGPPTSGPALQRPTSSTYLGPGTSSVEASVYVSSPQSLRGATWPIGDARGSTAGPSVQYDASMYSAQHAGTGFAVQRGHSWLPESTWPFVPATRRGSADFTGGPSIPASSEIQSSSVSGPTFWYGSTPLLTPGGMHSIEPATAQYLYLQQHQRRQPTGMSSGDRTTDRPLQLALPPPSSQRRTATFRNANSGVPPRNNNQNNF